MVVGKVNNGVVILVIATQTIANYKTLKNKENMHEFIHSDYRLMWSIYIGSDMINLIMNRNKIVSSKVLARIQRLGVQNLQM